MPDIPDQDRILRFLIRKQCPVRRDGCRIAPVCHIAVSADLAALVFGFVFQLRDLLRNLRDLHSVTIPALRQQTGHKLGQGAAFSHNLPKGICSIF